MANSTLSDMLMATTSVGGYRREQSQHDDGQHSAFDRVGHDAVHNQLDVIALIHDGGQVRTDRFSAISSP